jgi:hypothetical protein
MRAINIVFGAAALCALAACSAPATLPDGVALRPGKASGGYIDTRVVQVRPAPFARVKLCLAQTVSNPGITLTGGITAPLGLDITPHVQTVAVSGGDIFKYQDESIGTAIVTGLVDTGPSLLGTTQSVTRFELTAEAPEGSSATRLTFRNITRADLNTGTIANDGFSPVGSWQAAHPEPVIAALDRLAASIDACLK